MNRKWRWHLDEMSVKLNGEMVYRWRAVDHEREIFESYITKNRAKNAALTFMKKTLKRHGKPEAITTDGLRLDSATMTEQGNSDKQGLGRWASIGSKAATCRPDEGSARCGFSGECRPCSWYPARSTT